MPGGHRRPPTKEASTPGRHSSLLTRIASVGSVLARSLRLPGLAQLAEMAAALPPRPPSLRDACLQGLSAEAVLDIARRGTADEAAAWLESLEDSGAAPTVPAADWTHFTGAPLDAGARLSATLRSLAAPDDIERLDEVLGTLDDRVQRVGAELPDCIGAETKDERTEGWFPCASWCRRTTQCFTTGACRRAGTILDLCPEADIAEVIVVTPGGDRYAVRRCGGWPQASPKGQPSAGDTNERERELPSGGPALARFPLLDPTAASACRRLQAAAHIPGGRGCLADQS